MATPFLNTLFDAVREHSSVTVVKYFVFNSGSFEIGLVSSDTIVECVMFDSVPVRECPCC